MAMMRVTSLLSFSTLGLLSLIALLTILTGQSPYRTYTTNLRGQRQGYLFAAAASPIEELTLECRRARGLEARKACYYLIQELQGGLLGGGATIRGIRSAGNEQPTDLQNELYFASAIPVANGMPPVREVSSAVESATSDQKSGDFYSNLIGPKEDASWNLHFTDDMSVGRWQPMRGKRA